MPDGPFVPGVKFFDWASDQNQQKIKSDASHSGSWIMGKIPAAECSMANIDLGTRKDHTPIEDVHVPLDPLAMHVSRKGSVGQGCSSVFARRC